MSEPTDQTPAAPMNPPAEPTALELLKAVLPRLEDDPGYAAALAGWRRAAADRDAAVQAVREAHTAVGRTALQPAADRARAAEKEAAARLEAARAAAAEAVEVRTLSVLKTARVLFLMAGQTERLGRLLYATLAEHVTAAGLVPREDGIRHGDAEAMFSIDREEAAAEYVRHGAEVLGDWAFAGSEAEAKAVVNEAGRQASRFVAAAVEQLCGAAGR